MYISRSIKVWNVDELSYMETLFGHQGSISDIDAGFRERCVSAGGRDMTVRVWKIVEVKLDYFGSGILFQTTHVVMEVLSSNIGPENVLVKDVESCTYCFYVRCVISIVRVG